MHEFGALVEESRVVLVCLDHEEWRAGVPGGNREIERNPTDQEPGIPPGAFQNPGEHGGDRRLAVSPGDREHVAPREHLPGQPLRAGDVTLAPVEDGLHQRVAAGDDIAHHPQVRAQPDQAFVEPLGELDAERDKLLAHRRIDVGVAAGHAVARRLGDGRDAAHERAADAEDVKMRGHDEG